MKNLLLVLALVFSATLGYTQRLDTIFNGCLERVTQTAILGSNQYEIKGNFYNWSGTFDGTEIPIGTPSNYYILVESSGFAFEMPITNVIGSGSVMFLEVEDVGGLLGGVPGAQAGIYRRMPNCNYIPDIQCLNNTTRAHAMVHNFIKLDSACTNAGMPQVLTVTDNTTYANVAISDTTSSFNLYEGSNITLDVSGNNITINAAAEGSSDGVVTPTGSEYASETLTLARTQGLPPITIGIPQVGVKTNGTLVDSDPVAIDFGPNFTVTQALADVTVTVDFPDSSNTNEIQTISWGAGTNGNDEITLSDGGGTITITDDVNDADTSTTNELQTITRTAGTNGNDVLTLSTNNSNDAIVDNVANSLGFDSGTGVLTIGTVETADITVNLDGRYSTVDTDDQNLGVSGAINPTVTITDGDGITVTGINGIAVSNSSGNLQIDGSGITGSTDYIDAVSMTDTDVDNVWDIELTGIGNAGATTTVDLSKYLDNTDSQDLSLSGDILSISNDPNTDVDLSAYLDDTDNQNLGLSGLDQSTDPEITITDGTNLPTAGVNGIVVRNNAGTLEIDGSGVSGGFNNFDITDGSNTQTIENGDQITFEIAVTSSAVLATAVTATDKVVTGFNTSGASNGQVPKFNGTSVVWADDNSAASGMGSFLYTDGSATVTITDGQSIGVTDNTLIDAALSGNNIVVGLDNTAGTDNQVITKVAGTWVAADLPADDTGTDDQSISISDGNNPLLTLESGGTLRLRGDGATTVTAVNTTGEITFNTTVPDGSETSINQGDRVTITGTGTSGDPYVVTADVQNQNLFQSITDGTTPATAETATDAFKLRSAGAPLTIVTQNDNATHGDNALFTVDDDLNNYDNSVSQFIDDVTINVSDGDSLTGINNGGTITFADNNLISVDEVSGTVTTQIDAAGATDGQVITYQTVGGVQWADAASGADGYLQGVTPSTPSTDVVELDFDLNGAADVNNIQFSIADSDSDPENEGKLTVTDGVSNVFIASNTPNSTNVTLSATGIATVNSSSNVITIDVPAEVDGDTLNEIQVLSWDGGTRVLTLDNGGGSVTITDDTGTDDQTISVADAVSNPTIALESGGTIELVGSGATSVSSSGGVITITSTDNNTQLTQEQVQDFLGPLVSNNTETLISVEYNDTENELNFVVDDNLANYDNTVTQFIDDVTIQVTDGTNVSDITNGDAITFTEDNVVSVVENVGEITIGLDNNQGSDGQIIKKIAGVWSIGSDNVSGGGTADGVVDGMSLGGPPNYTLTLSRTEGLDPLTQNLAALSDAWTIEADAGGTEVISSSTVDFTGLTGISTNWDALNNELEITNTAPESTTVDDTPTLDLTLNAGQITGDVEVSATGGNRLSAEADGLYVPAEADGSTTNEIQNLFQSVTDGTTPATADASNDAFKLRSANALLTIVTANDDVTHGDNALFTIDDDLANYDNTTTQFLQSETQNLFETIIIGGQSVTADNTTDNVEFIADGDITITPNTTNDQITFSVTNTVDTDTRVNLVNASNNITNATVLTFDQSDFTSSVNGSEMTIELVDGIDNYMTGIVMTDDDDDDVWEIIASRLGLAAITESVDLSKYLDDTDTRTNITDGTTLLSNAENLVFDASDFDVTATATDFTVSVNFPVDQNDNNYITGLTMLDGDNNDTWDITVTRDGLGDITETVDLSKYLDNTDTRVNITGDGTTTINEATDLVFNSTHFNVSANSGEMTVNLADATDNNDYATGITMTDANDDDVWDITVTRNGLADLTETVNLGEYVDTDTRMQAAFDGGSLNEMTSLTFDSNDFDYAGTPSAGTLRVNFPADANDNDFLDDVTFSSVTDGLLEFSVLTKSDQTIQLISAQAGNALEVGSDNALYVNTVTNTDTQDLGWTQSSGVITLDASPDITINPYNGVTRGLVPDKGVAPGTTAYLRADGSWSVPPDNVGPTYTTGHGIEVDNTADEINLGFTTKNLADANPLTSESAGSETYIGIDDATNGDALVILDGTQSAGTGDALPFKVVSHTYTYGGSLQDISTGIGFEQWADDALSPTLDYSDDVLDWSASIQMLSDYSSGTLAGGTQLLIKSDINLGLEVGDGDRLYFYNLESDGGDDNTIVLTMSGDAVQKTDLSALDAGSLAVNSSNSSWIDLIHNNTLSPIRFSFDQTTTSIFNYSNITGTTVDLDARDAGTADHLVMWDESDGLSGELDYFEIGTGLGTTNTALINTAPEATTVTDGNTIDFTLTGTNITGEVLLSTDGGNILELGTDSRLYAAGDGFEANTDNQTLTWNQSTGVIGITGDANDTETIAVYNGTRGLVPDDDSDAVVADEFLREDGAWVVPGDFEYDNINGGTDELVFSHNGGTQQTILGFNTSTSDIFNFSVSSETAYIEVLDAGDDKIVFWDNTASRWNYMTIGSGLTLTGTDLTADGDGFEANTDETVKVSSNETAAGYLEDQISTSNATGTALQVATTGDGADEQVVFTLTPANLELDLSLTGNILELTHDVTTVNLAPYLDNTDNQELSVNSVANNPTVTLSRDDTPSQIQFIGSGNTTVSANGTNITISSTGDGTGTDNQNLILSGDVLTIEDGSGSVDLSNYSDGIGSFEFDIGDLDNEAITMTHNSSDYVLQIDANAASVFYMNENSATEAELYAKDYGAADAIVGWDNNPGRLGYFSLGAGLATDGTELYCTITDTSIPDDQTLTVNPIGTNPSIKISDVTINDDIRFIGDQGVTITGSAGEIDIDVKHDNLSDFVANEHINHTTVVFNAGDGLSGGGHIGSSRTFTVNTANSVTTFNDNVQLVNDAEDPGNEYYYGTNVAGAKGWYALPSEVDAENGLTKTGSTIRLGGVLMQDTEIELYNSTDVTGYPFVLNYDDGTNADSLFYTSTGEFWIKANDKATAQRAYFTIGEDGANINMYRGPDNTYGNELYFNLQGRAIGLNNVNGDTTSRVFLESELGAMTEVSIVGVGNVGVGSRVITDGNPEVIIRTRDVNDNTATEGALLQLQNTTGAANGASEFTPYNFPTTSSSGGNILITDNSGDLVYLDTTALFGGSSAPLIPSIGSYALIDSAGVDIDNTIDVSADITSYDYAMMPRVMAGLNGALYQFFRVGNQHTVSDNDPGILIGRKSIDGGNTWTGTDGTGTYTTIINDDYYGTGTGVVNVGCGLTPTGRIIVHFSVCDNTGGSPSMDGMGTCYSDDFGNTWTIQPMSSVDYDDPIPAQYHGSPLSTQYGIKPDGTLCTPITWKNGSGERNLRMMESTDNGLTWTISTDTIFSQTSSGATYKSAASGLVEPAMADLGNGVWAIVSRMRGATIGSIAGDNYPVILFSFDYGETWSDDGNPVTWEDVYAGNHGAGFLQMEGSGNTLGLPANYEDAQPHIELLMYEGRRYMAILYYIRDNGTDQGDVKFGVIPVDDWLNNSKDLDANYFNPAISGNVITLYANGATLNGSSDGNPSFVLAHGNSPYGMWTTGDNPNSGPSGTQDIVTGGIERTDVLNLISDFTTTLTETELLRSRVFNSSNRPEAYYAPTGTGDDLAGINCQYRLAGIHQIDMTDADTNVSVSINNPEPGGSYIIQFLNVSGSTSLDFPANFLDQTGAAFDGGTGLSIADDVFYAFIYDGTNFYAK